MSTAHPNVLTPNPKTLLVDTNVVLDVLAAREPHAKASRRVWIAIEKGTVRGLVAAHAVTTIAYLLQKPLGREKARRAVEALLSVFGVAAVDRTVLEWALKLDLADFEDAVTVAAARGAGCHWVVTRDLKGFHGSTVQAITPEAVLPLIEDSKP